MPTRYKASTELGIEPFIKKVEKEEESKGEGFLANSDVREALKKLVKGCFEKAYGDLDLNSSDSTK